MNYQKKIIKLITKSELSDKEKEELLVAFSGTGEDELKLLVELIENDQTWIRKLYQNYNSKSEALDKGDPDLWKKVLEDEVKILEEEK